MKFTQGRKVRGFAYNGQVPGPLIEAQVGDDVEVACEQPAPGDDDYWHGLAFPPTWTEPRRCRRRSSPVETFEYRFVVPDAGTRWYHSHTNETEQLERGLYGGLVVRGPDEPSFDRERVLILDDLKLDPEGEVAPFGDEHEHHAGREGEVRLVNGTLEPELEMPAGTIEALAHCRRREHPFRPALDRRQAVPDHRHGRRPAARARSADEVLLTPGERVDLAVGPFQEGELLEIEALPYDRGTRRVSA